LADPLYLLFSRDIELEQEPFSIIKFGEFVATLETPLVINAYRFDPLRSKALMIFNSELIFEMVENYYGGHSKGEEILEEERELTQTEINTVDIACTRIIDNLEKAWKPIKPIKIEHIRTETSPQLLNIYTHDDLLIVTKFKFSFSNEKSAFYIVMPYLMVDPLREQLELGGSQSDQEFDPNWVNALKAELLNVKLQVSAELAQKKMKLSEIKEWDVGDFIPLEITEKVPMEIEGYPAFHVKAGTSNNKRSLQVIYKIRH
jgi:flagellar motor switch protein FliM